MIKQDLKGLESIQAIASLRVLFQLPFSAPTLDWQMVFMSRVSDLATLRLVVRRLALWRTSVGSGKWFSRMAEFNSGLLSAAKLRSSKTDSKLAI